MSARSTLTESAVTSAAAPVRALEPGLDGLLVGCRARSCAITEPPGGTAASVAAGKISTSPSLSGSTWRPTSLSVVGLPEMRTVIVSPTLQVRASS